MMRLSKAVKKTFPIPSWAVPMKIGQVNAPVTLYPLLHLQQSLGNQVVNRFIQTKLKLSHPGDAYEQEADRVADQVMRITVSTTGWRQNRAPFIQRACEDCEEKVQRQMDEENEEDILLGKAAQGQTLEVDPGLEDSLQNLPGGQPLPESARSYFEPRFGYDFRNVRVLADSHAAEVARAVNARAFTRGHTIAFGAGEYSPGTNEGKTLLAHELAHVVQQGVATARIMPFHPAWGSQAGVNQSGMVSPSLSLGSQLGSNTLQLQKVPIGKGAPKKAWVSCVMPGKRAGLPAAFLQKLDNICGRMSAEGHPTRIFWGVRTLAQQVEIASRGRTFPKFKNFMLTQAKKGNITAKQAQQWIDHYDPKVGKNPMTPGFKSPVTWTLKSRHLSGKAADVAHPKQGWNVGASYKKALKSAAQAEGLQIGPPADDWAHVEVP